MPNSNIFISITMAAATELQEILAETVLYSQFCQKWCNMCLCSDSKGSIQCEFFRIFLFAGLTRDRMDHWICWTLVRADQEMGQGVGHKDLE